MARWRTSFAAALAAAGVVACLEMSPDRVSPGPTVPIAAVQGDGDASALVDRQVRIRGIVSGDFQDGDDDASGNLGGFFVQSATGADRRAGLFVFDGRTPRIDVRAGDVVVVEGTVREHSGETRLVANDVAVVGRADATATVLQLPATAVVHNEDGDPVADLERYEGQLVRIPGPLVVTDVYELERFGAIRLAWRDRLYQYTNSHPPDPGGYRAHRDRNAMRSIILDDGRREAGLVPIRYVRGGGGALRVGDTVAELSGNLRYSRGSNSQGMAGWRVVPVREPVFTTTNPRPGVPDVEGSLRVASFNVLNYFSTIDRGEPVCGPDNDACRGADSETERRRQLAKIVSALAIMDADIVGLIELENNASASLDDIVSALNGRLDAERYRAVATGTIGGGPIKSGFVYDTASVIPRGRHALLDSRVDGRFDDSRNRPALAQTFETVTGGGRLTVVINHLKSKGSNCDDDGDVNTGDGQGNCNGVRTAAAAALADWAGRDPTGSGDPDVLVIGDLNAYLEEDPLRELEAGGFVNLLRRGAGARPYSFVYDGQSGALDHALATPSLLAQVVAAIEWHINADESALHDYNLGQGRDPSLFDAMSPYRSADHDPVLIGIDLNNY